MCKSGFTACLVLHTGEPGGHQARQQEEDRADKTSFNGAQACKCPKTYLQEMFYYCVSKGITESAACDFQLLLLY